MTGSDDAGGWRHACRLADLDEGPAAARGGRWAPGVPGAHRVPVVHAIRDECTHEAVAPSEGEVDGGAIECRLHGSRFDLATGRVLSPPATRPVVVYAVRIEGERVLVRLVVGS